MIGFKDGEPQPKVLETWAELRAAIFSELASQEYDGIHPENPHGAAELEYKADRVEEAAETFARAYLPEWAQLFVAWAQGEKRILNFKETPVPDRVRELLEKSWGK